MPTISFKPQAITNAFLAGAQWKSVEDINSAAWCWVAHKSFGGRLTTKDGIPFILYNSTAYNLDNLNGIPLKRKDGMFPTQFVEQFQLKIGTYRNVINRAIMAKNDSQNKRKKTPENIELFKKLELLELKLWQKTFSNQVHRVELLQKLVYFQSEAESKAEQQLAEVNWDEIFSPKPTIKQLSKLRLMDAPRKVVLFVLKELETDQTKWLNSVIKAKKAYDEVKNQLVTANLKLRNGHIGKVNPIVFNEVPAEDLMQEATFGLMRAVEKFDPKRGNQFSTYCAAWLRHSVERYMQNYKRPIRVPVHVLRTIQKIAEFSRVFLTENGRYPTNDEIYKKIKARYTSDDVKYSYHSLYENVSEGSPDGTGLMLIDKIDSQFSTPEEIKQEQDLKDQLHKAMNKLTLQEQIVIKQRFDFDGELTLAKVGKQFNLSRERIRQLQNQALGKLKSELWHQGVSL